MSNRPAAIATVQVENESVRVTEWRFAPGAETGWHRHAHDYVVVPVTDGTLLLETREGTLTAELVLGRSYARPVGIEHNVINGGERELAFVEIEIIRP